MTSDNPMIETNDPRLTDYVLGELAPSEVVKIEAALKSSPELRAAVVDIRAATETITSVFQTEPSLQLSPEQKTELLAEAELANTDVHSFADNVTPTVAVEHYRPSAGSTAHWIKIAVAAGLAGLLLGGAYYFTKTDRLPMAASNELAHDSVAELEKSKSELLIADEDKEAEADGLIEEFDLAGQLHKGAKLDRDGTLEDLVNSAAPEGIQPKKSIDKKAGPRKADFMGKGGGNKNQPSVIADATQHPDLPRPSSKASPGFSAPTFKPSMPFAKGQSIPSENDKSNSRMLLRAQQALDRSTLGSLNLKVVAQNAPTRFSQQRSGLLDDADLDQPAERYYKSPAVDGIATREKSLSSPTTFTLQISDQAAKRVVQLLANQADPLQQRKLSFNELIGAQQLLLAENSVRGKALKNAPDLFEDRSKARSASRSAAGKLENTDSAKFATKEAQGKSEASQDAVARILASKLREHVGQPFHPDHKLLTGREPRKLGATMKDSSLGRGAGSKIQSAPQSFATGDSLKAPAEFAKPGFDTNKSKLRSRSKEFNFDYSLVIQQLKLNLEIRNQSVNLPWPVDPGVNGEVEPNAAPARNQP